MSSNPQRVSLSRIKSESKKLSKSSQIKLSKAQKTVARKYGFLTFEDAVAQLVPLLKETVSDFQSSACGSLLII